MFNEIYLSFYEFFHHLNQFVRQGAIDLATIGVYLWAIAFARVLHLEHRIKVHYKERDAKLKEIGNGQSDAVMRECQEMVEPLERQRRFILDKMPFMSK